jgi:energy-coupling factor transport system permease protein
LAAGGRRVCRTAYRPDPWRLREWVVSCGGLGCGAVFLAGLGCPPGALEPSTRPLAWPTLPLLPLAVLLLAGVTALAAPAQPRARRADRTTPPPLPAPVPERVPA